MANVVKGREQKTPPARMHPKEPQARNPAQELELLIKERIAHVAIIGLGYVGLPLARAFCVAGFPVTGLDIDARKIDSLKRGESYIRQIDAGWIKEKIEKGRFNPTGEFRNLRNVNAVIICVPTPL